MVGGHLLTETSLTKMDQNVITDVLGSDNVGATLFLHTVKKRVELSYLCLLRC
jgi:hypothetical protein